MAMTCWGEKSGTMRLTGGESNMLRVSKVKAPHTCYMCKITIKSGDYCLGTKNEKICLKCANRFYHNLVASLNQIKEDVDEKRRQLLGNFKEMIKNNLANNV